MPQAERQLFLVWKYFPNFETSVGYQILRSGGAPNSVFNHLHTSKGLKPEGRLWSGQTDLPPGGGANRARPPPKNDLLLSPEGPARERRGFLTPDSDST